MYTVCIKSLPPLSQRYAQPFIQNKLKSPSPNQSCIFHYFAILSPLGDRYGPSFEKKKKGNPFNQGQFGTSLVEFGHLQEFQEKN